MTGDRASRAAAFARRMVESLARREASAAFLATPPVPAPTVFGGPDPGIALRLLTCPRCPDARTLLPPAGALRLVWAEAADPVLPVLTLLSCESLEPRAVLPIVLAARTGPAAPSFTTRAAWCAAQGAFDGGPVALARLLGRLNAAESRLDPLIRSAASVRVGTAPGEPLPLPAATRLRADLRAGGARTLRSRFLGPHAYGPEFAELDAVYRATRERVAAALL
ncbi:hypothetical protein [Streptosporangium sp. NPDC000396]|uniref:hypothetical protein n=1 Tax=Streptosporangium sp. NPDC000396 TaxID=3366185 RepID=UPI0036BA4026